MVSHFNELAVKSDIQEETAIIALLDSSSYGKPPAKLLYVANELGHEIRVFTNKQQHLDLPTARLLFPMTPRTIPLGLLHTETLRIIPSLLRWCLVALRTSWSPSTIETFRTNNLQDN
ncbi:hypothetical protein KSP40_PGU003556 [Platanthera guangdongensis]|uniref:Uncharacterized protein n=1 Tax=Platanthera guangdongensis TaxID=2320717 RepID=A0ABR2LC04_9ASPA